MNKQGVCLGVRWVRARAWSDGYYYEAIARGPAPLASGGGGIYGQVVHAQGPSPRQAFEECRRKLLAQGYTEAEILSVGVFISVAPVDSPANPSCTYLATARDEQGRPVAHASGGDRCYAFDNCVRSLEASHPYAVILTPRVSVRGGYLTTGDWQVIAEDDEGRQLAQTWGGTRDEALNQCVQLVQALDGEIVSLALPAHRA